MCHVNGSRAQQERLAPCAEECRNVGGVGDYRGLESFYRSKPYGGDLQDEVQFRQIADCFSERLTSTGGITYQADKDFRMSFVGDDVGRAASMDGSDVECARSEHVIHR